MKLSDQAGCDDIANKIFAKSRRLLDNVAKLKKPSFELYPEHILVDLPLNKIAVRGGDILTRTEDGFVGTPNLFFDPEKWSQAYEHQKQCGFVFTPRESVQVVSLASRIVFFEEFSVVMDAGADRASKTEREIDPAIFQEAVDAGICSIDCKLAYCSETVRLIPIRVEDIRKRIPDDFKTDSVDLAQKLTEQFSEANPVGFAPQVHQVVLETIEHLLVFLKVCHQSGLFVKKDNLKEKDLQAELKKHLLSRNASVSEGIEVAGGETDLVVGGLLVVENKVNRVATDRPLDIGENYTWQARRYSIAISQNIAAEVVAYKPANEKSILSPSQSITVREVTESKHRFLIIRIVLPWGHSVPHDAKKPR